MQVAPLFSHLDSLSTGERERWPKDLHSPLGDTVGELRRGASFVPLYHCQSPSSPVILIETWAYKVMFWPSHQPKVLSLLLLPALHWSPLHLCHFQWLQLMWWKYGNYSACVRGISSLGSENILHLMHCLQLSLGAEGPYPLSLFLVVCS